MIFIRTEVILLKKYSYDIEERYNKLPKEIKKEILWRYFLESNKEKVDGNTVEIYRDGIGSISIRKSEILGGLRYLFSDGERAAILAIPNVITEGIEIEHHDNHKNRGYASWTFAAPVEINDVSGYMAVAIRKTDRYKYKMHRVLMPDGRMFEFDVNKKRYS